MTFREKSAWASLTGTLLVWGYYFRNLLDILSGGDPTVGRLVGLFIVCVVVSITLQVVLAVLIDILSGKAAGAPADERERRVDDRTARVAFGVLTVSVLAVAMAWPVVGGFSQTVPGLSAPPAAALLMSNGILLAVLLSEVVRSAGQIFLFRLGR